MQLSSAAAFRDAIQVTGGLGSEGCEDADPKVKGGTAPLASSVPFLGLSTANVLPQEAASWPASAPGSICARPPSPNPRPLKALAWASDPLFANAAVL